MYRNTVKEDCRRWGEDQGPIAYEGKLLGDFCTELVGKIPIYFSRA
jgi:hypothetical protein